MGYVALSWAFAAGVAVATFAGRAPGIAPGHGIAAYGDGYVCLVDGPANSVPLAFQIDTGASVLFFGRNQARRLGLDRAARGSSTKFETANGPSYDTPVMLHELHIGGLVLNDVPAWIGARDISYPLLGMSVLREMKLTVARGSCALGW